MSSYRKPAPRVEDVPPQKRRWKMTGEQKNAALATLLVVSAVVGALFLALGNGNSSETARGYPTPLQVWADNMNERIYGARCTTTDDVTLCDVRTNSGMYKVKCVAGVCALAWTQGNSQQ